MRLLLGQEGEAHLADHHTLLNHPQSPTANTGIDKNKKEYRKEEGCNAQKNTIECCTAGRDEGARKGDIKVSW